MPTYDFDSTGFAPANLIPSEDFNVPPGNGSDCFVWIPNSAPFYKKGFVVVDPNGNLLDEGVDFNFVLYWEVGSDAVGKELFGGIQFIDPNATVGVYKGRYQTVGDVYVDSPANAIQDGLKALNDPILLDWSTAPTTFPPTPHTEPLSDLIGMQQVYDKMDEMTQALSALRQNISMDDIVDFGDDVNPLVSKMDELITEVSTRFDNSTLDQSVMDKVNKFSPVNFGRQDIGLNPELREYDFWKINNVREKVIKMSAGDTLALEDGMSNVTISFNTPINVPSGQDIKDIIISQSITLAYQDGTGTVEVELGNPTSTSLNIKSVTIPATVTEAIVVATIIYEVR